jgi:diketogulonate reductase-like aldo/keto reductase
MGGGRWQRDITHDRRDIAAIQAAIQLGVTHLDTAESYGAGHSEELLGQAIKGYDRRILQIATKASGRHGQRDDLLRSFEGSLSRMGTDYIDLYQLHYYPPTGIDMAETMATLDDLVAQGAIKHIGVCNMTPKRLDSVQAHSRNKVVSNQVHFNLQFREPEHTGVLEYCQRQDVFCVAWRPLEYGTLPANHLFQTLARKYEATLNQIALSWLISQPMVATLVKTSHISHLKENLQALELRLAPTDIELLRHEFPDQHQRSNSVPLNYEAGIAP